jgi:crotonobetainyl-CoA:carnitine CoA-transferase CaiB-like acyl-CoA transferase
MAKQLPLDGIRVADLTIWAQGPIVSQLLADLGAEVIKVEKPGVGDFARGAQAMFGRTCVLPSGHMLQWDMANRNKKAIALNLYDPRGREAYYRLIKKCQVMLTNLSSDALLKMGADEESIHLQNPDMIYSRATGFGRRGPHADDPCQDTTGMARSGFMFANPTLDGDPTYPPGAISDVLSATMLAFGVVTALLAKERNGLGPNGVFASQVGTMMWAALYPVSLYANAGLEYPPFDRTNVANPLMNIYKCGDGKWFASGLFVSERFWRDFCEVMELEHLENDERFATDDDRNQNHKELIAILDEAMATQPRAEWERRFREKGFWCSIVNRYSDLPSDPQVEANEYIITLDNGLKSVAAPFELEGMVLPRRGAPRFAEHTDEVLRELCDYTDEDITNLRVEGVIW